MAAAEVVDPQLRAGVRSARASGVRCLKAAITKRSVTDDVTGQPREEFVLSLGGSAPEETGKSLEKEFSRCTTTLVQDKMPCLLLFRSDGEENIEGSRWMLVVWVPPESTEADRIAYMRSRPLLSRLVAQPYFLREVFARSRRDLNWSVVSANSGLPGSQTLQKQADVEVAVGINGHNVPEGPVTLSPLVGGVLQRLARREDPCIRLQLLGSKNPIQWANSGRDKGKPNLLTLDGKAHDIRGAAHLAKSGLPSSACYFAMNHKKDLIFILWCPETAMKKDSIRVMEEARYAVMKSIVLSAVLKSFAQPPARVVQINAREAQDIHEAVSKATGEEPPMGHMDTSRQVRFTENQGGGHSGADRPWPEPGAHADWPVDWPSAAFPAVMPSTLMLPQRPIPPWRGGNKTHTIGGDGGHSSSSRQRKSMRYVPS